MRALSSLERVILDCLGKGELTYQEIQTNSGLLENVCFNVLQALVIRGLIKTNGMTYKMNDSLSPLIQEEINGIEARRAESLEMIEAVMEKEDNKVFKYAKIAMDSRDEKIFLAMLSNLESFLADAHRKAQASTPLKERKVIFWGVGEVQGLMSQLVSGR
jgi:DNA-binding IclR family transcriptional regulator